MDPGTESELDRRSTCSLAHARPKLIAIPRGAKRVEAEASGVLPFVGYDLWKHCQLSWLYGHDNPPVASAQIAYTCEPAFVVEASSLELYPETICNIRFESIARPTEVLTVDLSALTRGPMSCIVCPPQKATGHIISRTQGVCIDETNIEASIGTVVARCLVVGEEFVDEALYSNLLELNCQLTAQCYRGGASGFDTGNTA